MTNTQNNPDSSAEISALVHRIHLILAAQNGHSVTFIAARSGEGTSTIARQFAEGLAEETESRVLLIDAGLLDRERFIGDGIDPAKGIVDAVAHGDEAASAVHSVDHNVFMGRWIGQESNRSVAGKLLHDAAFWESLYRSFTTIVIDAPALQTSADGIALASRSDTTVLVVEAETTRQPVIENARDTLISAGVKLAGSVMNKRQFYIPEKIYARL